MNNAIVPIIVCLFSSAVTLTLAFSNTTPVKMSIFGSSLDLAPGYLALATFALGVVSVLSFALVRQGKKMASNKIEGEWEKQDAKLLNEVQTDKVKLLEAKIDTLETALKSALSRNK
jgi:hypothetical protein